MATDRVWAIRGVSDRTRAAVLEAAHGAGLTIGEWLDPVLARAVEEARHPRPPGATREDVAELLQPLEEALGRFTERLASLEEKAGQPAETAIRSRTPGKNPRGPRLGLPR